MTFTKRVRAHQILPRLGNSLFGLVSIATCHILRSMFPVGKEQHPGNYDKGVLGIRIVCVVKRHRQLAGKPSAAS
jgi:hypothetical protein